MISSIVGLLLGIGALIASPYRPVLIVEMAPRDCVTLQHEINWLYERLWEIKAGLKDDPNDQFLQKQERQTQDQINENQARRKDLKCSAEG